MMRLYKETYPDELMADRLILEGLQLYELADKIMPRMLIAITWQAVKDRIRHSIAQYHQERMGK